MQQTGQIGLSKNQWNEIILNQELTKEIDMSIFQALYSFNDHKAYASQIGLLLGFKGKSLHAPLNSEIGRYAKRISKICEIQFTERSLGKYRYWDLFFNGWEEGNYFVWQLRSEIVAALENCKLTGEQPYAEELILEDGFFLIEGAKRTVTVNAYERNSKAPQ
jgi:5-methylcytosine-specific restriction protein A